MREASTVTTATISGTTVTSDLIDFQCEGFRNMKKFLTLVLILFSLGCTLTDAAAPIPFSSADGPFPGDYYSYPPFQGNRSAGVYFGSLKVAVMPVLIQRNLTLRHASIGINGVSTDPNVFFYFGIYNTSGILQTSATFPIGAGNPTGRVTVALSSPVTLTPGMWWFCQGSDDTTATATGQNYQFDTDLQNFIPGVGQSTNLISGGALPGTLGTISGVWPDSSPFVMLF